MQPRRRTSAANRTSILQLCVHQIPTCHFRLQQGSLPLKSQERNAITSRMQLLLANQIGGTSVFIAIFFEVFLLAPRPTTGRWMSANRRTAGRGKHWVMSPQSNLRTCSENLSRDSVCHLNPTTPSQSLSGLRKISTLVFGDHCKITYLQQFKPPLTSPSNP